MDIYLYIIIIIIIIKVAQLKRAVSSLVAFPYELHFMSNQGHANGTQQLSGIGHQLGSLISSYLHRFHSMFPFFLSYLFILYFYFYYSKNVKRKRDNGSNDCLGKFKQSSCKKTCI